MNLNQNNDKKKKTQKTQRLKHVSAKCEVLVNALDLKRSKVNCKMQCCLKGMYFLGPTRLFPSYVLTSVSRHSDSLSSLALEDGINLGQVTLSIYAKQKNTGGCQRNNRYIVQKKSSERHYLLSCQHHKQL